MEMSKGFVSLRYTLPIADIFKANIYVSDDSPPRACLADFDFLTMVLEPGQLMSHGVQLEGGTMMFMSPELLMPEKFGFIGSVHTPEADIYAFGLVIYQVCEHGCGYPPFTYTVQVLTGELPFLGLRMTEMAFRVVEGARPPKPENALAIGLSDSLWNLVERCWDADMKLRPKIAEVVSQLERAAADWDGVMPPYTQVESEEDSIAYCEFEILILP